MSDQVTSFTQRKKALDGNMQQLQRKVEVDLRQQRSLILSRVADQR